MIEQFFNKPCTERPLQSESLSALTLKIPKTNEVLIFTSDSENKKQAILNLPYRKVEQFPFLMDIFSFVAGEINAVKKWLNIPEEEIKPSVIRILKKTDYDNYVDDNSEGKYLTELNLAFVRYSSIRLTDQFKMGYVMTHEMYHAAMNGGIIQATKLATQLDEGLVELLTTETIGRYLFATFNPEAKEYWQLRKLLEEIKDTNAYRNEYKKALKMQTNFDKFKEFLTAAMEGKSERAIELYLKRRTKKNN